MRFIFCTLLLLAIISGMELSARGGKYIACGDLSDTGMYYAGQELQRYIFQLSGEILPVKSGISGDIPPVFVLGTYSDPVIVSLIDRGLLKDESSLLGDEGYALHTIADAGKKMVAVVANTSIGCLYGVYGLLDDHYEVGFYMGGDVLPQHKTAFYLPDPDEYKKPAMYIRGFLPWTNFPQSATVYSWEDWKFIIDQTAKMRMNFIQIHNYNGQNGHNEMFHNFTVNGYTSRTWMPTAKTGHRWACPGFEVKNFRFGGGDLFADYDFGSDCALHNESLSNQEVFEKGTSLFKKVIAYAHKRGVKIALGIDIDLILPEYCLEADDPAVIEARISQINNDYPDLDYLILFVSEMINHDEKKLALWKRTFNGMYTRMKKQSPDTRIAVAGWGLKKEIAQELPEDVIAAPISGYSDSFEDGSIYGDREYWGCPWLERDVYSSCYYYPYEMHLSNTISAYQKRAPNMKGLYCLTWRITDAVDAKLSYIAKTPWDTESQYNNSFEVYGEYARKNYGLPNADSITFIINQNEPVCSRISECESTARLTGDDLYKNDYLLNIKEIGLYKMAAPVSILSAYHCDELKGVEKTVAHRNDSCISKVNPEDYLVFRNVNFGKGVLEMSVTASTQKSVTPVEFRLDSLNGRTLGVIDVIHSGGWQNWRKQYVNIFETQGTHDLYIMFNTREIFTDPYFKALSQLETIDRCINTTTDKGMKQRLNFLRCRIAAARDFMDINKLFPHTVRPEDLPGAFPSWVTNFTRRVNDISSLGNTQSIQNRYVQERYLAMEKQLSDSSDVKFPTYIQARGTKTGAVISWQNNEKDAAGFYVYRNGVQINKDILSENLSEYYDTFNGKAVYQVSVESRSGKLSWKSETSICHSGSADKESPYIVVVSPPVSARNKQGGEIIVRILDNREYKSINATMYYRNAGDKQWKNQPMQRRVKAVFTARFPLESSSGLIEYYVKADDGDNISFYPATAPELNQTLVYEPNPVSGFHGRPEIRIDGRKIHWKPVENAFIYKIYRTDKSGQEPDASSFLTYIPATILHFEDKAQDYIGNNLSGTHYYRIVAEDKEGNRSSPSQIVEMEYD